jgi:hypothetical protein
VGRRDSGGRGAGGGESIPTSRSGRARLAVGAAAVLLAAGFGAWPAVAADEELLVRGNATLAVLGTLVLAAGIALRFAPAVPGAVALLGAEYVLLLGFERDTLDVHAPLVAAALLTVAELGYWTMELHGAVADEPGTYLRRGAILALLLLATVGLGTALLALVGAVSGGGLALDLLGVAAAVGALALVTLASRAGRASAEADARRAKNP